MGKQVKQQRRQARDAAYRPTPAPVRRIEAVELTLESDPWVVNGWASQFSNEVGDTRRALGITQQRAFEITKNRWQRELPRAWFNLRDQFLGRED